MSSSTLRSTSNVTTPPQAGGSVLSNKPLLIGGGAVVLLILTGVAVVGVRTMASGPEASSPAEVLDVAGEEWFTVTKRTFPLTVVSSGELDARDRVEVRSKVGGRPEIIDVVKEGTTVEKGEKLVKLEDEDIRKKIEEETLNVEKARASLVAAEQELAIARKEAESKQRAAEVKLSLAKLELDRWRNGDVIQKRRELKLAVDKAERRLKRAERDYELSKDLYEQKFISFNELDDSELERIEASEKMLTAKQDIEIYESYTFKQEEQKNTSDVDQAESELDRTVKTNESKLAQLEADFDSKKRTLSIRETRLAELEEQLENTVIVAPTEGMVVYATSVGPHWRRRDPISPGRQVRFNETVIILPNTQQMVAALKVHEALVRQVKEGQTAAITIDAKAGTPVEGKVIDIGVMAEDGGWVNPQLREYTVKVALPKGYDNSLKPAMRCSAQIFVGQVEDQLAVPVQAVFAEGDQQYVYVPAGRGRVRRQPIETDRASESYVEVTSGLQEGVAVLLRKPDAAEVVSDEG